MKDSKFIKTYTEWATTSLEVNAMSAWNYQQKKIDSLLTNWSEAVCRGQDSLRARLEEVNEEKQTLLEEVATQKIIIQDLKNFLEENLKHMGEMEMKVLQQAGVLNG